MKLSKTEQKLIKRAEQHCHNVVGVVVSSRYHKTVGTRDRDAAFKLVQKGIFEQVGNGSRHSRYGKNGGYEWWSDYSFRLK